MRITKFSLYLHNKAHQRYLKNLTLVMFIFLVFEKLLSGASATYNNSEVLFAFKFTETDVLSLLVYISMTLLLIFKVEYKYLLIPDFVLFALKTNTVITGINTLYSLENINPISELSTIESVVESFLFSLFLFVLFCGKLFHLKNRFGKNYPFLCLYLLIFCFPITVLFEIIKIVVATELHQYPFIIIFNFIKGVLNEAFLDLPYALLIIVICFIPKDRK